MLTISNRRSQAEDKLRQIARTFACKHRCCIEFGRVNSSVHCPLHVHCIYDFYIPPQRSLRQLCKLPRTVLVFMEKRSCNGNCMYHHQLAISNFFSLKLVCLLLESHSFHWTMFRIIIRTQLHRIGMH